MLLVEPHRQDVPSVQGLSIPGLQSEWSDLVVKKTPLLWDSDVLEPGEGYAVEVDDLVLEEWDS